MMESNKSFLTKLMMHFNKEETRKQFEHLVLDPILHHILDKIFPYIILTCVLFILLLVVIVVTLAIMIFQIRSPPAVAVGLPH
jgi:hypothetical protein